MALLVNDVVKMEWEKSLCLTKGDVLYFAGKMYKSSKYGDIIVGFNPYNAFIIRDGDEDTTDDFWEFKDIKKDVKDCPHDYDSADTYVTLLTSWGEMTVDDAKLEEYGLTEFKADIEARRKDIAQYATSEDD